MPRQKRRPAGSRSGADLLAGDRRHPYRKPAPVATGAPVIIVRRDAFDPEIIEVVVEPSVEGGDYNREFDNHRAAYGWAVGLRTVLGLSLRDETA